MSQMSNALCGGLIAVVLITPGCAQQDNTGKGAANRSLREDPVNNSEPIGTATMTEDGTITLDLRAQNGGTIGQGQLVYRKDDRGYADVLKRLGGLQPGRSKLVPPWPDNQ
jgi:hypothetical protein